MLADYEAEVVCRVTDPRTGLPRTHKFLPNPAEVAEACDEARKLMKAEKVVAAAGWIWGEREGKWMKPNL